MDYMLTLAEQNWWRDQYRLSHPGWRPATEVFAARVQASLHPMARLLDVGCGRGGLIEQLDHPLNRVIGIDPDFPSLREHRLGGLPRATAVSDRLPFMRDAFDIVTAAWLFEHLENPLDTFSSVHRILRPGGVFIFITPNARHPLTLANRMAGRFGRVQGKLVNRIYARRPDDTFPTFYRANTPESLTARLTRAGFTIDSLDFIADPSYMAFNSLAFRVMSAVDDILEVDRHIHIVGVAQKPISK